MHGDLGPGITADHATMPAHVALHGPKLLLLFRGQQLADVLHLRDMGQTQVRLFGGDGLDQLLHFGEIRRISLQQWQEVKRHGLDLRLKTNHVLGMRAQEGLHLSYVSPAWCAPQSCWCYGHYRLDTDRLSA